MGVDRGLASADEPEPVPPAEEAEFENDATAISSEPPHEGVGASVAEPSAIAAPPTAPEPPATRAGWATTPMDDAPVIEAQPVTEAPDANESETPAE
jgi:hypothetical protein